MATTESSLPESATSLTGCVNTSNNSNPKIQISASTNSNSNIPKNGSLGDLDEVKINIKLENPIEDISIKQEMCDSQNLGLRQNSQSQSLHTRGETPTDPTKMQIPSTPENNATNITCTTLNEEQNSNKPEAVDKIVEIKSEHITNVRQSEIGKTDVQAAECPQTVTASSPAVLQNSTVTQPNSVSVVPVTNQPQTTQQQHPVSQQQVPTQSNNVNYITYQAQPPHLAQTININNRGPLIPHTAQPLVPTQLAIGKPMPNQNLVVATQPLNINGAPIMVQSSPVSMIQQGQGMAGKTQERGIQFKSFVEIGEVMAEIVGQSPSPVSEVRNEDQSDPKQTEQKDGDQKEIKKENGAQEVDEKTKCQLTHAKEDKKEKASESSSTGSYVRFRLKVDTYEKVKKILQENSAAFRQLGLESVYLQTSPKVDEKTESDLSETKDGNTKNVDQSGQPLDPKNNLQSSIANQHGMEVKIENPQQGVANGQPGLLSPSAVTKQQPSPNSPQIYPNGYPMGYNPNLGYPSIHPAYYQAYPGMVQTISGQHPGYPRMAFPMYGGHPMYSNPMYANYANHMRMMSPNGLPGSTPATSTTKTQKSKKNKNSDKSNDSKDKSGNNGANRGTPTAIGPGGMPVQSPYFQYPGGHPYAMHPAYRNYPYMNHPQHMALLRQQQQLKLQQQQAMQAKNNGQNNQNAINNGGPNSTVTNTNNNPHQPNNANSATPATPNTDVAQSSNQQNIGQVQSGPPGSNLEQPRSNQPPNTKNDLGQNLQSPQSVNNKNQCIGVGMENGNQNSSIGQDPANQRHLHNQQSGVVAGANNNQTSAKAQKSSTKAEGSKKNNSTKKSNARKRKAQSSGPISNLTQNPNAQMTTQMINGMPVQIGLNGLPSEVQGSQTGYQNSGQTSQQNQPKKTKKESSKKSKKNSNAKNATANATTNNALQQQQSNNIIPQQVLHPQQLQNQQQLHHQQSFQHNQSIQHQQNSGQHGSNMMQNVPNGTIMIQQNNAVQFANNPHAIGNGMTDSNQGNPQAANSAYSSENVMIHDPNQVKKMNSYPQYSQPGQINNPGSNSSVGLHMQHPNDSNQPSRSISMRNDSGRGPGEYVSQETNSQTYQGSGQQIYTQNSLGQNGQYQNQHSVHNHQHLVQSNCGNVFSPAATTASSTNNGSPMDVNNSPTSAMDSAIDNTSPYNVNMNGMNMSQQSQFGNKGMSQGYPMPGKVLGV